MSLQPIPNTPISGSIAAHSTMQQRRLRRRVSNNSNNSLQSMSVSVNISNNYRRNNNGYPQRRRLNFIPETQTPNRNNLFMNSRSNYLLTQNRFHSQSHSSLAQSHQSNVIPHRTKRFRKFIKIRSSKSISQLDTESLKNEDYISWISITKSDNNDTVTGFVHLTKQQTYETAIK